MITKSERIVDQQGRCVELRLGSIGDLHEEVGAIVSDDDAWLSHGGSVAAAIWDAAGSSLEEDVRTLPALTIGDVHVTTAGRLPAQLLFHAITIDHETNLWVDDSLLRKLYRRTLEKAETRGLTSLALPLLGTGPAGVSKEASAAALSTALAGWLRRPSDLTHVIVCVVQNGWVTALTALQAALADVEVFGQRRPERDEDANTSVGARASSSDAVSQVRELELVLSEENAELVEKERESGRWVSISQALASDVQSAYESEEPDARRELPLGAQVELFLTLSGQDEEVPRELENALRQAAIERNRLAHGLTPEGRENDVRQRFERALHELKQRGGKELPAEPDVDSDVVTATYQRPVLARPPGSKAAFEALDDEEPLAAVQAAAPPRPERTPRQEEPPAAAIASAAGCDTEPVRRLHEFLSTRLDDEQVARLDQVLGQEDAGVDQDVRLLEFCVRVADPAAFLASEFSARELRREVDELTGQAPDPKADATELAWTLLREMGFRQPATPSGLDAAVASAQHASRRLQLAEASELRGLVVNLSRHVEYISLVLLQFICSAAFGRPAAAFLRENGLLEPNFSLHRCSLGRLVELLESVGGELESSELERARLLRQDLSGRTLFPKGATNLAGLRNAFAHYKERVPESSLSDLRLAAQDFVVQSTALFDHLGSDEGRIFPQVISIRSIQLDRFGRRLVEAVNDAGLVETIFTDSPLEPGGLYFMHARSGPVAVYPLLVPAGDLRWTDC